MPLSIMPVRGPFKPPLSFEPPSRRESTETPRRAVLAVILLPITFLPHTSTQTPMLSLPSADIQLWCTIKKPYHSENDASCQGADV